MKKKTKEYNATYHPDFLVEWQKYEKAYGSKAAEKFTAWIEKNGLDVEFPLDPQIPHFVHKQPMMPRQEKQTQENVVNTTSNISSIATENDLGRLFDGYGQDEKFKSKEIVSVIDNKKYFEFVADVWRNTKLGPIPQIVGKKNKR